MSWAVCYSGSNNIHFNFPPIMADGRNYASWQPDAVINNRIQSNKFEDCVFWYKAKKDRLPPNWKFGHPSAWQFHESRMDPNYTDSVNFGGLK
jgi:hypothetical protein